MGTKENFKMALNELVAGKTENTSENQDATPQKDTEEIHVEQQESAEVKKAAEVSIIAKDLEVEGNLICRADIRISGRVKGDVRSEGIVRCSGVVEGDVSCDSIFMTGCSIQGNISARSRVNVDTDSIVVGDVSGQEVETNGRIRGNIKASSMATIRESAMLMGNINAKSISLSPGASLKGSLEIESGAVSENDFVVGDKATKR